MKKILTITGIFILGLLVLAFLFISPIAKYIIEKNSEAWTGRKIRIESLWINIFGGSIHMKDFRMLEAKSDSNFIRISDFYGNISINKLLAGKYYLETVRITGPEITISQKGEQFNFDDLIKRFADTTAAKKPAAEPVQYFIDDFSVSRGIVHYRNFKPSTNISLVNLVLSSPPLAYTDSIFRFLVDFGLQSGGKVSTYVNIRPADNAYGMFVKTNRLNLGFLLPYLRDYMKVNSLDGLITTNLLLAGRTNRTTDITSKGVFAVEDFSIVDTTGEKLAAFRRFLVDIDSLSTPASLYNLKTLTLDEPYVRFGMYVDGYNFDRILTAQATDTTGAPIEDYSNIFQMMAGYIRALSQQYLLKAYRVDTLRLTAGHVIFTDYTLEEKFQYDLDSLSIRSDNFNSANERIVIALGSRLNQSGIMDGTLSVNPKGYSDMDIDYGIHGLLISDINPYSKYYVATPFLDGVVTYTNSSNILDYKLKSMNHLLIERIRVGEKVQTKAAYNLPIKLAVAILRDPKGNIDLKIPVEGDLKDPKYKLGKVIWQVVTNLLVKAATAPYKLMANAFGGKETDYKEIQFQYLQKGISEDQHRILDNLAKVVQEKPEVKIEFVQVNNKEDEAEQQAIYRAKKDYLGYSSDSISQAETKALMELSAKDSLFNLWLDKKLGGHAGLTSTEDRCMQYCGKEKIQAEVAEIMTVRNGKLQEYMTAQGVATDRMNIHNASAENQAQRKTIPRYLVNFFVDGAGQPAAIPADSVMATGQDKALLSK